MFTLKKTFSILSMAALLLVGCATDGDTGPAGPVGPEGAIGPAGQDGTIGRDGTNGTNGQDGANGTASLLVSNYTVLDVDWTAGKSAKFNANISGPIITSGVVNAYRTSDAVPTANSTWIALPVGNFGYEYKRDSIVFTTPGFSGANFTTYFKVVVITPGAKIDGFDYGNYEEVKMVYGLED
ncbi:MAG: hypothetical protein ACJAV5_002255 [Vicingaceae bacterium]|jgi:hypothetical protein